ncbi:MAG: hypothetical protein WBS18_13595 [Candidatus Acidiferrales bacterium]
MKKDLPDVLDPAGFTANWQRQEGMVEWPGDRQFKPVHAQQQMRQVAYRSFYGLK